MIKLLRQLTKQLTTSSSPRLDAEILLSYVLKVQREDILTLEHKLTSKEQALLDDCLHKRKKGQPIEHITEQTEFYGLKFYVTKSVFIPRPETEKLVEKALDRLKPHDRVLDMGAGTGCIGLTLALRRPDIFVHAWEKSKIALNILSENYRDKNSPPNYSFELFNIAKDKIPANHQNKYNMVLSNPPYIGYEDQHIDPFVKKYEPHLALFSGPTGFECLNDWSYIAYYMLVYGGIICFEIGFQQALQALKIFKKNSFADIKIIKDNAGLDRIIVAKKV